MSVSTVYCYHADVGGNATALPLIEMWVKTWLVNGWAPVVLNESVARLHPRFDEAVAAIAKLPTVNGRDYERACYLRHLAMSVVGGGLLVDYDVMNRSFKPEDFTRRDFHTLGTDACSGAIWGAKSDYERIVSMCFEPPESAVVSIDGQPHTSDMYFILSLKRPCTAVSKLVFEDQGWETSPLVHFANGCVARAKTTQIEAAARYL